MKIIECLKSRRSIRSLEPGNVKREMIEEIVDCGRFAPTANNVQPCDFVVITAREKLAALSKIAINGPFIKDASFCIIVIAKDVKYYLEDGCAATENILLAAHANGLSSCWVAGDKKDYVPKVLDFIGAPSGYKLISILPVGYSDCKSEVEKRSIKEVLHWEKF